MLPDYDRECIAENHLSTLSTFRRNGAIQLSLVLAGPYHDGVAFSTPGDRAKYKNLLRDPRCSILISKPDWFSGYVVIEGKAQIIDEDNTDPAALLGALRNVYRVTADSEHPNWDEYDQAMVDEHRAVIIVNPEHVYGTALTDISDLTAD